MRCSHCGDMIAQGEKFCGSCGTAVEESQSGGSAAETALNDDQAGGAGLQSELILRIVSGVLLAGGLTFCIFTQTGGQLFVLLIPVFAGLLVPLLQIPALTGFIERLETRVADRRSRAQASPGKFARFVRRPFYACAAGIWSLSDGIKGPHIRAGARVVLSLYFVTLFSFLLFIAAEIVIGLVIVVAMLWLMLWVFTHYDDLSRGQFPRRAPSEEAAHPGVLGNKVRKSREETGIFGDAKRVHHDRAGDKVGETRGETGIFGDPKGVHYNRAGDKVGESREETGIFGDSRTVHYDREGNKIGESREEAGMFGDTKTVHYDRAADKVGESRDTKDLFGNDVTEHFDKDGEKSG